MNAFIVFIEFAAPLVGVLVGTWLALWVEKHNERRRKQGRAHSLLRAILQELDENHRTVREARPTYRRTAWGKSIYVSTIAWETAVAGGDLVDVIGTELADAIAAQYAQLVRIRYYVDLFTRLWLAPDDIDGYENMRRGFHHHILTAMDRVVSRHDGLSNLIMARLA